VLGLRARLKRLEDVGATQRARVKLVSPALELHCKLVNNARRRLQGLLPEPLTPTEHELKREQDEHFLLKGIPRLRREPSWQDAAAQATLDQWEQDLLCETSRTTQHSGEEERIVEEGEGSR
jgi:hypothetical protein